ncbi:WUSCHEL-related homeobox 11-like [Zingiber officinale]|uniref:WUSCHEL-related homeobox 11-like n=1 Tax=Zingiber officinale TaxID=94328 RepID=UPI001C4AB787|nr:WUSCHEL-related homeobox 11-like [Zingiber officinale]
MSKDDRSNSSIAGAATTVRTRWAPKPEQILILESIFNSGMVNPPKDETVRIRKLLEKFGAVGDANVFYWFQNRRSRSRIRRRQRELQAASAASSPSASPSSVASCFLHLDINNRCSSSSSSVSSPASSSSSGLAAELEGGPVGVGCGDDLFHVPQQTGPINPLWSSDANNYHQPESNLTVFINGVQWEVPRGPLDTRAMFGQNLLLVHSSGQLLPVDECGILLQSLQMGESYFLTN